MGPEVTGFEAFLYRLSDFSKALMLPVVLVIPRLSRLATLATVLARTLNYCMLLVSGWPLAVDFSRHWNENMLLAQVSAQAFLERVGSAVCRTGLGTNLCKRLQQVNPSF